MPPAASIDIVFQTRFSFFGQSGWRSQPARNPELLFATDRLEERFRYFEMVTLPSLVHQTDLDYCHMVLSSTLMPEVFQRRLDELVKDTLGAERAAVFFRPEGHAGTMLRREVNALYGKKRVAQVVLDDDDALAKDFVAIVRAQSHMAVHDAHNPDEYLFLSFPRGLTVGFENGCPAWLEHRYVQFTNLGLTLITSGNDKRNPYNISHRKVGKRHPSMSISHLRPYYMRAVHAHNDSNAKTHGDRMKASDMEQAFEYFPFLDKYFAERPQTDAGAAAE